MLPTLGYLEVQGKGPCIVALGLLRVPYRYLEPYGGQMQAHGLQLGDVIEHEPDLQNYACGVCVFSLFFVASVFFFLFGGGGRGC